MYNKPWGSVVAISLALGYTLVAVVMQTIMMHIVGDQTIFIVATSAYRAVVMSFSTVSILLTYLCFDFGVLHRYRATNEHLRYTVLVPIYHF